MWTAVVAVHLPNTLGWLMMRRLLDLFRAEPRARSFFALLTQSSFGTGAAYVALLLVAYDRFQSPWAISLVLVADLVPPMLFGVVFGAAADRWSRRTCAVVADAARALAFVGIAVVESFPATVAFALLAGAGTALFTPATLAALPSLVAERRLPLATSIYGAITDVGLAVGPALTALFLLVAGPETVLAVNAATFAVSALFLARLDFGKRPEPAHGQAVPSGLFSEARAGLRAIRGIAGLPAVLGASAAALFFGGLVNVAELPFITGDLGASEAAFSLVIALVGLGIATGSLAGGRGGPLTRLRRRYLIGLLLIGIGFMGSGLAESLEVVLATFLVAGFGNGLMLVYERLIVQATVEDRFAARVFGVKDSLGAWAFAVSFVAAGGLVSALGPGTTILVAGGGVTLVALCAAARLGEARVRGQVATASSSIPVETRIGGGGAG
jgi:MFS family permease